MRTLAGPNTNALKSITGYNVGSPLRMPAAGAVTALTDDVSNIASGNVQAQSAKGEGARILGDTAKYAAMGAAAGPIGAGVGALVGLTVGLIKNKKAKAAYKEEQTEQANERAASNAQAQLAANVNSQNQANNEIMANTKPGIKRTLSSLGYSSSIKKQSSMEYNKSEMMRTISGVSSLKIEENENENTSSDETVVNKFVPKDPNKYRKTRVTDKGDKVINKDGQDYFMSQSNNKEAFLKQYKKQVFKDDKVSNTIKHENYNKNNPEIANSVSAEALKNLSEKEKKAAIANYRSSYEAANTEIASNKVK